MPRLSTSQSRSAFFMPPMKDAPPQPDPKLLGLQDYVASGRVFLGPGYFFPAAIPIEPYLQQFIFSGDVEAFLAALDTDWKRLAIRLSA